MKRRTFLAGLATALASRTAPVPEIDISQALVVTSAGASPRERKAARVLIEEIAKRSQIELRQGTGPKGGRVTIYLATHTSISRLGRQFAAGDLSRLSREGFIIRSGADSAGRWIALLSLDEKGLFFCVGRFLQLLSLGR